MVVRIGYMSGVRSRLSRVVILFAAFTMQLPVRVMVLFAMSVYHVSARELASAELQWETNISKQACALGSALPQTEDSKPS